eukprot:gb/GEZN01010812.1/.p1 GENE.gb/GEZN01010812.1/~~gb/GEZN01010812.1/.p1  ORF type:complete len:371 (-),score=9.89 gb/GEZN01010812.1/:98-1090(-)
MITSDQRNRTFNVYIPTGYSNSVPTPVVFVFHGGAGTATQAEQTYLMNPIADFNNFIVLYPDGVQKSFNAGTCCGGANILQVDDVTFFNMLLDRLETELCVDTRRVYSTGFSNGALMSHRLACEASNRVAAIAPVSGTLNIAPCEPTRPVPIMELHGTADINIPFNGGTGCGISGANFSGVPFTVDFWAQVAGCNCTYADTQNNKCGTTYLQENAATCTKLAGACIVPVVLCMIQDGGHGWPGGVQGVAIPGCNAKVANFNASMRIWEFFASNPIPTTPSTTTTITPTKATITKPSVEAGASSQALTNNQPTAAMLVLSCFAYLYYYLLS